MRKLLPCLLSFFLFACNRNVLKEAGIDPYQVRPVKQVTVSRGAVACAHPLASAVGVAILRQGGNAFDAAIATQLALAVVYPNAGNLGGGGFLVAVRGNGEALALDYREQAPAKAHRDMYLDAKGQVIPNLSVNGHLSGGVPGTVAGLFATFKYARLPFKKLVAPAIELAEKGFALTQREAASLNGIRDDLRRHNTRPTAFLKEGEWKQGDTLFQPELAQTLRRIRDRGAAGFYEGETAALLVAEMERGNGLITAADLQSYTAKWRTPHRFWYRGHEVVSMPMPSSGGVLLHQMLKMVEAYPLASYGFLSPRAVQLMIEAERRAYADRAEYMGDADFYPVPVNRLTDSAYLLRRMQDFRTGEAGSSVAVKPGLQGRKESPETTHLSIVDAEGNAVAVTTTLNNSFGSKTVVGGAGFLLNDEMDDFSAKPGVPNLYGAVGGEANAIQPGKRMLSSMTPTIVCRNGKPFLVAGTPGGTTIATSVFQTVVDILDFGLSTDAAVNGPKFHHQWLPDEIQVEKTVPQELRRQLEKMGYRLVEKSSIGRTEVIRILPDGRREAVADSRGDDSAAGY